MGKFVIRKVNSGIKFDLKAANGQTVLTSEVYSTEAVCRKGIESVRKNAPRANIENQTEEGYATLSNPQFEMYEDRAGKDRSEDYSGKAVCLKGIESVKINSGDAEIMEE